jgi:hypothetical protein
LVSPFLFSVFSFVLGLLFSHLLLVLVLLFISYFLPVSMNKLHAYFKTIFYG